MGTRGLGEPVCVPLRGSGRRILGEFYPTCQFSLGGKLVAVAVGQRRCLVCATLGGPWCLESEVGLDGVGGRAAGEAWPSLLAMAYVLHREAEESGAKGFWAGAHVARW